MNLGKVFPPESIILNLESTEKDELFEELVQNIVSRHPEINREEALAALLSREQKMTTGILPGIAVPHCGIDTAKCDAGAIGISKRGIDYDSLDKKPVHFVFMLICNSSDDAGHLENLKKIAILLKNKAFVEKLSAATSVNELADMISNDDNYMEC